LNRSLPVDRRLWAEDIAGSQAWVRALQGAGVLAPAEAASAPPMAEVISS
jgi:argininosuccinate lyase